MRPAHYLSVVAAIALVAILYFGVNTVPPPKSPQKAEGEASSHNTPQFPGPTFPPASFDSLNTAAHAALPAHGKEEISVNEKSLAGIKDSATMSPLYDSLASVWKEHKQLPMAAWATGEAARLAHSEKKLTFAAQIFLDLAHREGQDPPVQLWEAQQAAHLFDEAILINPANDTLKLGLAASYIEGTGETMKGVGILREITAKEPDNIPANLMLGGLSIQSGQWDKAIARYETILKREPNNREALYFGGVAYKGKGDLSTAKALFEKVKKVVNDPAFSKEVDGLMNDTREK